MVNAEKIVSGSTSAKWCQLEAPDFTDVSQDASATNNQIISWAYDNLFSGQWWVVIFPSLLLVILVMAINAVGDWLRDALNPRLR